MLNWYLAGLAIVIWGGAWVWYASATYDNVRAFWRRQWARLVREK